MNAEDRNLLDYEGRMDRYSIFDDILWTYLPIYLCILSQLAPPLIKIPYCIGT